MSGRLIAIGDIHGCSQALDLVLQAIAPEPDDTIVGLGDFIDRGPDSKGVIDRMIHLGQRCNLVAIQGNHEEMMLEVVRDGRPYHRWIQYGGVDTLDSYGFGGDLSVIGPDHMAFFESMVDFFEADDHFFVHANYDPNLPLEATDPYTLRWKKLTESTPGPHFSGRRAIVGHTHDRAGEIFDIGHLVCIDTYCYGGGWLTALEARTGQIWQARENGETRMLGAANPS
ncbi:MAG: serine/threonine protein phosphatase [Planctomycetota bacterium]|nr:MAG: serine/threonine protein phosphatase [Planctomycetota bacterium]